MNYVPYTYRLICPNGMYYYGVKYANNKRDIANPSTFWVNYFTSCSRVHELIKIHGKESFTFEIRKTFKTAIDAIEWESKVNKKFTTKSKMYLNGSYIDGRIQSGDRNGNYGKIMKEKSKIMAISTRLSRNDGKYMTSKNVNRSYLTPEWKLAKNKAQKEYRYKLLEIWDNFKFPINPHSYMTSGTRKTPVKYFAEYIVNNNLITINGISTVSNVKNVILMHRPESNKLTYHISDKIHIFSEYNKSDIQDISKFVNWYYKEYSNLYDNKFSKKQLRRSLIGQINANKK